MKEKITQIRYKIQKYFLKKWIKKKFKKYSFSPEQIDLIVFGMFVEKNRKNFK